MAAPKPNKKRYPNERQARAAADYLELTKNVELGVYKDIDGGWYLTSKRQPK